MSKLLPHEKLQWAETHRQHGNKLYSKGKYIEAMDVYLTCLVAIDKSVDNNVDDGYPHWEERAEKQIKLPVLLNLSACTLKLGMYKKTCAFCDMALELQHGLSPKVLFRRGKARISMGMYKDARGDLLSSLTLLDEKEQNDETLLMKRVINKEVTRLQSAENSAEINRARQEQAMKLMLGGHHNQLQESTQAHQLQEGLYFNTMKKREYSTLRAPYPSREIINHKDESYFVVTLKFVACSLRKMLTSHIDKVNE